jgi:O-antigen/teichoic acid export membrane protein
MMAPEILRIEGKFDFTLWRQMVIYAFPLMIAGFAGNINETFDRILIPHLIPDKSEAMAQVGIYGACYKLSIIMTLFIQTFRYAAEPFFFNHSTKENPQLVYAQVMKMFIIVCSLIFVGVMLYIDIIKQLIGPGFRSGLKVVPILLMANLCMGVYYNLSIWYKLTAKTRWGAWLSIIGAFITLIFNFLLIPLMGYMGAAWATLICYSSMMAMSYYVGQKYYPVKYDVRSFFYYIFLSLLTWVISILVVQRLGLSGNSALGFNTLLMMAFIVIVWFTERRKISYLRGS